MASSTHETKTPVAGSRKSKHALAKLMLHTLEAGCATEEVDRDEGVEALLTACILDMQNQRGSSFTREYLDYELSSLSSGDMYDVQKR